jgi:hypothetical protein
MTEVSYDGKDFRKEDFNTFHGILLSMANQTTADTGSSIFGRCKALLLDEPLYPPMERCHELNGYYRCVTYNFVSTDLSDEPHSFLMLEVPRD